MYIQYCINYADLVALLCLRHVPVLGTTRQGYVYNMECKDYMMQCNMLDGNFVSVR